MCAIRDLLAAIVRFAGRSFPGAPMAKRKTSSEKQNRPRVVLDPDRLRHALANRRQQLGWSLRDLAEKSGVSSSAVHALEQGNTRAQLDNFVAVLAALELTPDQVLVVDGSAPPLERSELERKLEEIREVRDPAEAIRLLADLLAQNR